MARKQSVTRYDGYHQTVVCNRTDGLLNIKGDTIFPSALEYRAYIILLQYFRFDEIEIHKYQELLPAINDIEAIGWKIDFYIKVATPFYIEIKGCNDDMFKFKYNLYRRFIKIPILIVYELRTLQQYLEKHYIKILKTH